jgi:uncharacterized protein YggE
MRRLSICSILGAGVVLIGCGINPLRADELQTSHVTGQGSFEMKRQPEFLRVQVEVLAKARSAKDALAKLQERRLAARTKLEGMGAAPEAIEFSEPMIVSELDPREAQMQAMMARRAMMMQMAQGGKKAAAKPKEAPPVVVSCVLKAQIRLSAPNPEEMLLLAHGLEERIKAADLGGTKALKQVSPQEEELAQEEMQGMMNGDEQRVRGQPFLCYVSKLTAEDRTRAVREAFKRAERQASELAGAAGLVLGPVCKLEEAPNQNNDAEVPNGMEFIYAQLGGRVPGNQAPDDKNGPEAVGIQPAKVVYRVVLTATFEMRRLRPR